MGREGGRGMNEFERNQKWFIDNFSAILKEYR
jgi:hypothetical protein